MSTSCASVYPAALIAAKKNTKAPPALDAGLLAAAQAVEHYEISRYGTLRAWAEELGLNEAVEVLQETLEEEEGPDRNREFGDKSAGRSSLTLWRHEFSAPLLRGVFYNIVMAAVLRGNCGAPATFVPARPCARLLAAAGLA